MTTQIQNWLETSNEGFSFSSASSKTGISVSSVRRHLTDVKKTQSTHETVVAICRAYNLPVMEGLIRSGLVTREEAGEFGAGRSLQDFSQKALLTEMLHRVSPEETEDTLRTH